jgi:hypothetical protein
MEDLTWLVLILTETRGKSGLAAGQCLLLQRRKTLGMQLDPRVTLTTNSPDSFLLTGQTESKV